MGLKIKLGKDGRVAPEIMDLMRRLAEHRDLCSQCKDAMQQATGNYCATGATLVLELEKCPDAEFTKE